MNKDYASLQRARSEPSELDLTNIDWLFDEFAEVWDEHWTRKTLGKAKEKKQKWAWALAGKSREELQQALNKAILTFPKPPEIADFNKLLPESLVVEGWNHAKAAEIIDKKIRRIIPQNYDEVFMLRMIFRDLEQITFNTASEHCDFAVCAVKDCYHYEVFSKPYLGSWLCKKHFEG